MNKLTIIKTIFFIYLLINNNICNATEYLTIDPNLNSKYFTLKILILIIFIISYLLVILEEYIHIKKSKITIITATIIWSLSAIIALKTNECHIINNVIKHNLLEYCELFLFLFITMIYINAMKERGIFDILQLLIINKNLSYKQIYWLTGLTAFFISPIADNLTTALIMCSIITTIGHNNKTFINLGCINIVVAANSGGAFSPFGDITTLMIWQTNMLKFQSFFNIFFPSLISFLIPSIILYFYIPTEKPSPIKNLQTKLKFGAISVVISFIITIFMAIILQNYLHLPAVIGMMTGLTLLQLLEQQSKKACKTQKQEIFYIHQQIAKIKWDTLFFFYGIILCIGGLSTIGYINELSLFLYNDLGSSLNIEHKHTPANILIGFISAIIDNIPIVFAVLTMNPQMNEGQWLLITLTAGTGGSLLSIGSAAGIAIMGQTNGAYTFFSHAKWSWAILLGYIAGACLHLYINNHLFLS